MKTKIILCCLIAVMLSTKVHSQMGYLRKDTLYLQGRISDQRLFKNNRQLIFREKKEWVTYAPSQVLEYGFTKGDVYVKKTVQDASGASPYFLLRLVNGERTLYALKEKKGLRLFIEHDSTLVEIKKSMPLEGQLLHELKPCGDYQHIAVIAKYNRASLRRALLMNNRCYTGLFPTFRAGALMGYESSNWSVANNLDHAYFSASNSTPLVGVFIDFPLGTSPFWFMNVQATYQQNSYGGFRTAGSQNQDYQFNFSTLSFPILFKYRGSASTWRPFVSAGPTPAFYTQQANSWLTATRSGGIVNVVEGVMENVKKFQMSATLGVGIEYSVTQKKAISLELRLKKLIDAGQGPSQSWAFIGSFYF